MNRKFSGHNPLQFISSHPYESCGKIVREERLRTLWSGQKQDFDNPGCHKLKAHLYNNVKIRIQNLINKLEERNERESDPDIKNSLNKSIRELQLYIEPLKDKYNKHKGKFTDKDIWHYTDYAGYYTPQQPTTMRYEKDKLKPPPPSIIEKLQKGEGKQLQEAQATLQMERDKWESENSKKNNWPFFGGRKSRRKRSRKHRR